MPELAISDSCIHCGGCVAICPWQVIELTDGRVPRYQDGGAERCILCGHCEAVCLTGALLLDDPRLMPTGFSLQSPVIEPARFSAFLRMRRSIRRYDDEPVERGVLEQLMEVVRYAPTGRNRQDVHWLMLGYPAIRYQRPPKRQPADIQWR